jgi:PAS domain S-box-containing protein
VAALLIMFLKTVGIQKRIIIAIMVSALAAFVLFIVCLLAEQRHFRQTRVQAVLDFYANLVAEPVANPAQAQEVFAGLCFKPEILEAEIRGAAGQRLAVYPANRSPLAPLVWQRPDGVYLGRDRADALKVLSTTDPLASRLFLRFDLKPMLAWQRRDLLLLTLAVGVVLVVIVAVQFWFLRRWVLAPTALLADQVERAGQLGDYSQRIPLSAGWDDFGRLKRSFNQLLAAVERRELDMRQLSTFQRTILDNAAHAIVTMDNRGLITSLNPAAEKLLGWRAAELVGKATPEIFHLPAALAELAQELAREFNEPVAAGFEVLVAAARRGLRREREWEWVGKDGSRVAVMLCVTALRNDAGEITGFMGLAADITERKQAELRVQEREAKYRLMFENLVNGFALHEVVYNEQGKPVDYRFLEVNPAFEHLIGLNMQSVVGRKLSEVMPDIELEWLEAFKRVAATGQPFAGELRAAKLDKHFETWMFRPRPDQLAVMFSDVTARRRVEAELRQKNSLLEATLQATADGIIVVSADGRITGYNQQLVKLWRVPGEILESGESARLFAYLQNQLVNVAADTGSGQLFNCATKGETFDVLEFGDGRIFERYSRPQWVEGQVVGRVWSFRDVTAPRQTEAALRESEYKFKTLFETANDAILLYHNERCVDCNQRAAEMFGCPREQLLREERSRFVPECQAGGQASGELFQRKSAAAMSGQAQSFEWIHCRADGSPFNTEVSLNRVELNGKQLLQTVVRDITQRKLDEAARHAAEELYRTLVNASPDGISVLDLEGRITFASPRALELFGLAPEPELAERTFFQHVSDCDQGRARRILRAALEGRLAVSERFGLIRQDGITFVAELSAALLRDSLGVPSGIMVITHDASARQLQEDELRNKNSELERFTYTVSHDLKSPLITIKGFAGALLLDLEAGRTNRLAEDLKRVILAAEKMTELLNGLLELSRIGRMVNPPTRVSLNDLARVVVELLSGTIAQRQAQITVQPDLPPVYGDAQRLQEVLQNLVENALKFPLAGGRPRIEIGAEEMAGQPAFYVRDHGRGIEPRYQETIFGLFNKLDAHTEGTGIGLALVRRIVEYHGGRIWVQSQGLGCGATFYFTLPHNRAISKPTQPTQPNA